MKTQKFRFFGLLTVLVILSMACNLSGGGAVAPTQQVVATVQDEGAAATVTPVPPTETPVPPTETLLPAATSTETATPEPSATSTEAIPTAEVVRESSCRVGPAGAYELVAKYQPGQKLQIIARDLGGGFVFVQNPEKPEDQCYILESNLKISGEVAALPQYTPPASPTAAPAFKATYKNLYICKGSASLTFLIENTGGSAFRSAYIKAKDIKTGVTTEQVVNAFDLLAECVVAKNIAPLKPGSTGYLYTVPFKIDIRGRKLNVIIQVCTEQNLRGACSTQVLEVKPN
jgi:hypothetical protein